jgi:polyhydroxybutyrate depolymerase
MFIIRLKCRPVEGGKFLQNFPHPLIIALVSLLISLPLLFMVIFHTFISTPASSASASVSGSDTLTTFPIQSTGCGKPSPIAPGTSVDQTLLSGGIVRSYLLHIPRGYNDRIEQPLVLNFHGHGSSALQQQSRTGFSSLANNYDVIVAYPQGVVGPDHHTGWNTGPLRNPRTNDVLFVSNLLHHLQSTWCVNPYRIYATGFSNGGGMTNVLACKLAGRFAAFASVSGAYPTVPGGCHPVRPVPFIELHGTGDTVVPYNGSFLKGYPPVASWLREWAMRDGCASEPTIFFKQASVVGEKWMGCRDHVTIIHYLIGGMGHTWPRHLVLRSREHTTTLDATNLIWTFFQSYSLPPESART